MQFVGFFENLFTDTAVQAILLKLQFIWIWALIASAILTAFFLVVTLAQIEAGIKPKPKWRVLTFCSLAVVVGLIIVKPKPNLEPIQYIPAPPSVLENVDKSKDEVSKKSASKSTGSASGLAGGEKSQGVTGKNQGAQGQSKSAKEKAQGEQGSKGAPETGQKPSSTQDSKLNYRDPVLEEILAAKRQAEEKRKETVSEETSDQQSSDTGTSLYVNQQKKNSDPGDTTAQQRKDYFSESQTDENNKREHEPQIKNQQTVKAKVLVSFLNVRDKGSLDGLIIGSLNAGDIVEVVEQTETGEWINIKLTSGQKGWVLKNYLEIMV